MKLRDAVRNSSIDRLARGTAGALGTLSLLAVNMPALAADARSGETLEEVIVTGYRASIQQSLDAKRESDMLIDVISAEDIGKFPDKNIAESLQRVPGVAIARDYGEGEKVSIRGTDPSLSRTLLNGHSVATADWFILDERDGNRSFNYTMLPSEAVSRLDIYKSSQADVDEGGIGGTVNVHTRKPLDLPAMSMSGSAGMTYGDLTEESDPSYSGIVSWHNQDSTFGALLGFVRQKRHVRRDGVVVIGQTHDVYIEEQDENAVVPELLGPTFFEQLRDRKGGNLSLQWRPVENLDVSFDALYFKMDANHFNHSLLALPGNILTYGRVLSDGSTVQPSNTVIDSHGSLIAADFPAVSEDESPYYNRAYGAQYDAIMRDAFTDTKSFDLNATYRIGESLSLHGQVGKTKGRGTTEKELYFETGVLTGFSYDLRGTPNIQFDVDEADPSTFSEVWLFGSDRFATTDDEDYAFLDAEWQVDGGLFESFKAGVKYSKHDRDNNHRGGTRGSVIQADDESDPPYTYCDAAGRTTTIDDPDATDPPTGMHICGVADVNTRTTPGNFLSRYGLNNGFALVDAQRLRDLEASLPVGNASNYDYFAARDSFFISEKIYGGYVMSTFGGDRWHGNLGVRIVRTEEEALGWIIGASENTPGAVDNQELGTIAPLPESRAYTDVLPSLNLKYELTPELILRGSVAKVMARPDYGQISPTLTLREIGFTGNAGNTKLDPFRSTNYNIGLEWYFGDQSILAAALFDMEIDGYIVSKAFTERHQVTFRPPRVPGANGLCTIVQAPEFYECTFSIFRPVNAGGGRNKGVELTYGQPIWRGFGFQANYTYSDAKTDDGKEVPGNSDNAMNLTVYFENMQWSARVSYNYRSDYFIDNVYGGEQWGSEAEYVDASLSYTLLDSLTLTLEGRNLGDEKQFTYYDNIKSRTNGVGYLGREYYFGARMKF